MLIKIKKVLGASVVVAGMLIAATGNVKAAPTYVGSWAVADGPLWTTNPTVYSGQEVAALLWGGVASDYYISTVDSNPLNINHLTFLDGFADTMYLTNAQSETFKFDTGNDGYSAGGAPAYSAYVFDHACGVPYCDNGGGDNAINFAFRIAAVPEPETYAMLLVGLGILGFSAQRKKHYDA
jgi:hypothetical protein